MKYRALAFLIVGITIYAPHTMAKIISEVNFENRSSGPYTASEVKKDWSKASIVLGVQEGRVRITSNGLGKKGKALRVEYPKGKYTTRSGASWRQRLQPHDELYASYYVFFPKNWDPRKGGKLPGLCGGKCPMGGAKVKGDTGFSARYMFKSWPKISLYLYYMGKSGKYGENFYLKKSLKRNKWIKLTQRVKLNTPGKNNGEIQVWMDNQNVLSLKKLKFRTTNKVKINKFAFSTFYGGSSRSYAPNKDEVIYFDNFKIYTKRQDSNKIKMTSPKRLHIKTSEQTQLSWTPTAHTTGYAVYQKAELLNATDPLQASTYNLLDVIADPETTSLSLETLPAGATRRFAVTAFNDAGEESELSNAVSATAATEAFVIPVAHAHSDASTDRDNHPSHVLDGDPNTLWQAQNKGQWLELDLGAVQRVDQIAISWFQSHAHAAVFDLDVSSDGKHWVPLLSDQRSGKTTERLERFAFSPVEARYVRYIDLSGSEDTWSGVSEVEVYASQL